MLSLRRAAHSTLRFTRARSVGGVELSNEVDAALRSGKPVVALESTIISHGMPYPQNLAMAHGVEDLVRSRGAVPATIAVIKGVARVGLDGFQLEHLAKEGRAVRKCSRRDLAAAIADGADGATTVASTMLLAHHAGLRVFATGGIGGVHRGAESTMDISADLTELSRTPVAVVCAGVKSILDIGRTLEFLETQGVPVVCLGTDEFPAFFSTASGFAAPQQQPDATAVAQQLAAGWHLGLENGTVVAVPNPFPDDSAELEAAVQTALREATEAGIVGKDATPFLLGRVAELTGGASLAANIALVRHNATVAADIAVALSHLERERGAEGEGKDCAARRGLGGHARVDDDEGRATFVDLAVQHALDAHRADMPASRRAVSTAGVTVADISSCSSDATAELRALLAAEDLDQSRWEAVAAALQAHEDLRDLFDVHAAMPSSAGGSRSSSGDGSGGVCGGGSELGAAPVIVIGGATVDLVQKPATGTALTLETSNPGTVVRRWGGVGRNIAEGLARLGARPVLLSAVGAGEGDSATGAALLREAAACGVDVSHVVAVAGARTATYAALLDGEGGLVAAVADMDIMERMYVEEGGKGEESAVIDGTAALPPALPPALLACLRAAGGVGSSASGGCRMVVADGNLPVPALRALCDAAREGQVAAGAGAPAGAMLFFEPTSVAKARKLVEAGGLSGCCFVSPNEDELAAMSEALGGAASDTTRQRMERVLGAMQLPTQPDGQLPGQLQQRKYVVLTLGAQGVLVGSVASVADERVPLWDQVQLKAHAALPLQNGNDVGMVNCTGAGDSMVAGMVAAMVAEAGSGAPLVLSAACIAKGLLAARLSVECDFAVSPLLGLNRE